MTRWAHYALLCGFPQACKEKHVAVEGFMVYCVVWEGVTECSNTLEDEEDTELLPQALVYKPCRQLIYGLLLLQGHDGRTANLLKIHMNIINTHAQILMPSGNTRYQRARTQKSKKEKKMHLNTTC